MTGTASLPAERPAAERPSPWTVLAGTSATVPALRAAADLQRAAAEFARTTPLTGEEAEALLAGCFRLMPDLRAVAAVLAQRYEQLGRAVSSLAVTLQSAALIAEAVPPQDDPRERALRLRQHRNTGPAVGRYRLDGTRRRP